MIKQFLYNDSYIMWAVIAIAVAIFVFVVLRIVFKQYVKVQNLQYQLSIQNELAANKQIQYDNMQREIHASNEQLKIQFESLSQQIFAKSSQDLVSLNKNSIDALLRPLSQQVQAFKHRVNQIHSETIGNNASLYSEIQRVANMGIKISNDANNLTNALLGQKKTLGNWGEMQLERSLQLFGLHKDLHYNAQPTFKDKQGQRRQPDFVVLMPDDKHLVIDSKVSLVDYNRAISADDPEQQRQALNMHINAIKNHINDLASKSYNQLDGINSPPFVLMYFPIESAYMQALEHDQSIFEYGWNKQVVMVSHTTLLPIIKTISGLWSIANSTKQARLLGDQAGDIYNQVALIADRLNRLGVTLTTANRQYNDTVTALAGQQGLANKVNKFAQVSSKAKNDIKHPTEISVEVEHERLQNIKTFLN